MPRLYKKAIKTIKAVFRDSGFRGAFKERFGVDDKMIQEIDSGVVNTVSKNKGNKKYIDNLAEIIIHEGGHWGDFHKNGINQEHVGIFKMSAQSKSGRPDAGDNWEVVYFGTDTQFSDSDSDIITEKFDKIRRNNITKDFIKRREIRDLKSQKMPSIFDNYKKPKDNLRTTPCY